MYTISGKYTLRPSTIANTTETNKKDIETGSRKEIPLEQAARD